MKKKEMKVGDVYEIPVEGSLGLFATGYRGVQLWRKKRDEALKDKKNEKSEDKEQK